MYMEEVPVITPRTQTKGFFTILEKIALQVVLPSDAGEEQIPALLVCLQGSEHARCHIES